MTDGMFCAKYLSQYQEILSKTQLFGTGKYSKLGRTLYIPFVKKEIKKKRLSKNRAESIHPYIHPSNHSLTHLIHPSIRLSVHPPILQSIHPSIQPNDSSINDRLINNSSIHPSFDPSIHPSSGLGIHLRFSLDAFSRTSVVSYWRKHVQEILVHRF